MAETKNQNNNTQLIDSMFKAGAHFAFSRSRRHPTVAPYIFGVKNRVEIFDLEKTNVTLEDAKNFVRNLASEGKQILFVGVKPEIRQIIKEVALSLNAPYIAERFIGGTLTNFPQIKKRIEKLHELLKKKRNWRTRGIYQEGATSHSA
jgi:small subunit ribosomal protein S2